MRNRNAARMTLSTPANDTGPIANKVATVTFIFWIMKICATTVGETGGDLLSMTLNIGYAASSLILIAFFLVALALQMRAKGFHPFLYWAVILATSTAGTTISDYMDRSLGLGYATGAGILATLLVAVLLAWRFTLGSIRVDHLPRPPVAPLNWAAFSGYFFTPISRTALFWAAFVLTRPFGATMGDLLTKSPDKGGLGIGTAGSSAVLLAILVGLILYTIYESQRKSRSLPSPGSN